MASQGVEGEEASAATRGGTSERWASSRRLPDGSGLDPCSLYLSLAVLRSVHVQFNVCAGVHVLAKRLMTAM